MLRGFEDGGISGIIPLGLNWMILPIPVCYTFLS